MGAFELATPLGGLLEAFEGYVEVRTVKGSGPGKSGASRLDAMRNKPGTADTWAAQGDTEADWVELASAVLKTDGQTPPPDLITGAAASLLAADIHQAQADLGCE